MEDKDYTNKKNKRIEILGIPVDNFSKEEILKKIRKTIINNKEQIAIIAINPKKIMLANEDKELKSIIQETEILIPDSAHLGRKMGERITGIDLMENICNEVKEAKIFLYGSIEENVKTAKINLERKNKDIEIVGYVNGFVYGQEVIDRINNSKANILFVALGSPKQEKWIHSNRDKIKANVIMGVGGSIDVLSGKIKRAPRFIRKLGLEWLYRMIKEPKRFKDVPKFIKYLNLIKKER